jgi:hypothetical protein
MGNRPDKSRRVYEALASTRASRGDFIVDHPNGTFSISEGGYKPYRREKVKQAAARWRKNNQQRAAENKWRNRQGDSYVLMSAEAWEAKLREFAYVCSAPGCERSLTLKTAIRWQQGATCVPICRRCLGKKAADKRWKKRG